jgi:hypothetical protein
MIDWEDEGVATQDRLMKQMIDTVGIVVLVVAVITGLCFA